MHRRSIHFPLHLFPAGLGLANPSPELAFTLGPKALQARMTVSAPCWSPGVADNGEVGPGEAGRGICVADRTVLRLGVGRGRPNAPAGIGKEDEWVGLLGREDLRYDSVKSEISDVSSYDLSAAFGQSAHFCCNLHANLVLRILLYASNTARVDHPELDRASGRAGVNEDNAGTGGRRLLGRAGGFCLL